MTLQLAHENTHTHMHPYTHTYTYNKVISLFPNTLCVSVATGISAVERGEVKCSQCCRKSSIHFVDMHLRSLSVGSLLQVVTRLDSWETIRVLQNILGSILSVLESQLLVPG